MGKKEVLKPRLIECVERMRKLLELDAPPVLIGAEAFSIFATTLAVYGTEAGWSFLEHLRKQNLKSRAVCAWEDCIHPVEREETHLCAACEKKIGCDAKSLAEIDENLPEA